MYNIRERLYKFKTPIFYTGSAFIKALASIIVSFIIAKYVSPEDLGLWSTISLILTYSVFFQGGIINGLNLELPYYYGKGKTNEGNNLAAIAQTYVVIIGALILLFGIFLFLFYPFNNDKLKWGIITISLIIPLTFYQSYLLSTFRSNNSFLRLSYIQFFEALLNIVTVLFIVYYAYYGMLVKSIIVISIYTISLFIYRPIRVQFYWNKKSFFHLMKIGIPIFSLAYMESFASTIDKIWLVRYTDLTQVGLYSFGLYSLTMITLFSTSVSSYIYPKMTYNYGMMNDKLILWKYVKKITVLLFVILTPIVMIGYFLLPYFIKHYFPSYILSTKVMQILLIAGLFKGCVVGVNMLWSIKKWKFMIIYQSVFSLLFISLTYIGLRSHNIEIEGIAYGVLFTYIINFINGITLSYIATHK